MNFIDRLKELERSKEIIEIEDNGSRYSYVARIIEVEDDSIKYERFYDILPAIFFKNLDKMTSGITTTLIDNISITEISGDNKKLAEAVIEAYDKRQK